MIIKIVLIFTALSQFIYSETVQEYQDEIDKKVIALVKKHYPKAKIERENSALKVSFDTMVYTVHNQMMTGEFHEKAVKQEGPRAKGFILFILVREGPYQGQAGVPQTFQKPYWQSYINAPKTKDEKNHYFFRLKYRHQINEDFMKELFNILPGSKNPMEKANKRLK